MTCEHCGEAIGVYEPIGVVIDGELRETSRAAEPSIAEEPAELYHKACYLERFGPPTD